MAVARRRKDGAGLCGCLLQMVLTLVNLHRAELGTRLGGGNLSRREVTSPNGAGLLHAHTGVNEEGKQGFITQSKPKMVVALLSGAAPFL